MIRILANDGIHPDGRLLLEEAECQIDDTRYPQEQLAEALRNYDVLLVRSATKVRKELIDQVPNLKAIGRGGVGMDNIDVEYARSKGIYVFNTPAASSKAVAELAFAHIFTLIRGLHDSNRQMPVKGQTHFKELKATYSKGIQLRRKHLGILGFGRIGQEVAKIGLALGMRVRPVDPFVEKATIRFDISENENLSLNLDIYTVAYEEMLQQCDIISLHIPFGGGEALIGAAEIARMKKGAFLINASRGGIIDEAALIAALDSGHLAGAGLDVFDNEPTPSEAILTHPKISLSPHVGAETLEAQSYIGMELAERIIEHFGVS